MAKKYKNSLLDIIKPEEVSKMFAVGIAESNLIKLTSDIRELISGSSESDLKILWDSYLLGKGEISTFDIKSYPSTAIELSIELTNLVNKYRLV